MNSNVNLTAEERASLRGLSRSRTASAADAKRARLIMMLDEGLSWSAIGERLPCTPDFIGRWKGRFERERLAGLYARHQGRQPGEDSAKLEARVLAWTQKSPADGSTHWSTRKLGKALGVSHMMVKRIWAKHGLKPRRIDRYMAWNDPDFETKAADVIGLYLNSPAHAAVFCADEKTAIQALDRKDPVPPFSPGRIGRNGFEYCRDGTLSLYAAFNSKTGEALGKTAPRHTSAEFVAFLEDIVAHQPKKKEIHVIADNLSAHKTKRVDEFLTDHPHVHLHFIPTCSSWLNQVELWFAKIERDVIARGVFSSVPDLRRKLMRCIRQHNRTPKPVKWVNRNPGARITKDSGVTVHTATLFPVRAAKIE